jgi:hypothetical protein
MALSSKVLQRYAHDGHVDDDALDAGGKRPRDDFVASLPHADPRRL